MLRRAHSIAPTLPLWFFTLLLAGGCSKPITSISLEGGTTGRLTSGSLSISEVEIKVYRDDMLNSPLGFGDVNSDGKFQLLKADGSGSLMLQPGRYRCSLHSIGNPNEIPSDYTDILTSPIVCEVVTQGTELLLEVDGLSNER